MELEEKTGIVIIKLYKIREMEQLEPNKSAGSIKLAKYTPNGCRSNN